MSNGETDRLAVLIDADNAMASVIDELLKEISKYGTPTVKRAYGDWTTTSLKSWKAVLHKNAIQPEQQFSYTSGKNSTDSALIIDAMDLLYSKNFEGFCIVSSDSDFTRLATRIRQDGLTVYGFGEQKTPEPFVAACDKFVYLEVLKESPKKGKGLPNTATKKLTALKKVFKDAIDAVARDDGWAALSMVGSQISKTNPSFDPRAYGYAKMKDLVAALGSVEIKNVKSGEHVQVFVKLKSK
jgi:uncharacterized LabA/DUF88 family protein